MVLSKIFCPVNAAILVLLTSSAAVLGQDGSIADPLFTGNGEHPLPWFSRRAVEPSLCDGCSDAAFSQSSCYPRWTASADFIFLDRIGSVNQTLVARVPNTVPVPALFNTPGLELLNSNDLHQGFSGGPKVGLIRHGDGGLDLELSYFQIDGWNAVRSIGPTPNDWLVMKAPGGFLQTQDQFDTQKMAWDNASQLYNAEVNLRWNPWRRVTMLAGFRWVNLTEQLQGTLPPQRATPFWDNQTRNNLYGLQMGAEGKLFERGGFSFGCIGKAGLFVNHAEESTTVSIFRLLFGESASTDHAAFVGEFGLQGKYQVTRQLSLRAGYQAIWLQGVALAPGQIPNTFSRISQDLTKIRVQATGVNSSNGVFYHGATAGLEFSF